MNTQHLALGDVCLKIGSGATPRGGNSSYKESGISLVRSMNVRDGSFTDKDLAHIDEDQADKLKNVVVKEDDVLLNITGASVARCCIVDNSILPARVNQHVCILRPSPQKLHHQYLMHFLKAPESKATLLRIAGAGATREAITKNAISNFKIPLPPLPEQKRIAQILDGADALRAKRRESIAQLDALVQSTFLEMFGDPVSNKKGFETKTVAQLCKLVRGSSPRPKGDPAFYGEGVPRLMVADVTRDGFSVTPRIDSLTIEGAKRSRPVPSGTVVMAVSGNVGLVSRVNVDCCIHDGFVGFLELNEETVDPVYFMHQLHLQKTIHEKSKAGAIFKNITTTDIKRINIQLPKMERQLIFSDAVKAIQSQISLQQSHLTELNTLFASLQSRAFNGQL